jgi:putative drug exporter of the RND superfamily
MGAMTPSKPTFLARLAALTVRRRRRVVLAWVGILVAVLTLTPLIAGSYDADFTTPGSQSEKASKLIENRFPGQTGDTVTVVWQSKDGVRSPSVQKRMDAFFAKADRVEDVGRAQPPRISRDGTIAVAEVPLTERSWDVPKESGEKLIDLADETGGNGLRVELGGNAISNAEEGGSPEGLGLLLAAVILLIAFGSVVAAGLPLAVAIFGLAISSSLIGVLALLVDMPDFAPAVAGLIGIGVGTDYALLVLTRFRTALAGGKDVGDAVTEAVTTAGRSAIVAGGTVVISVLGLFFMGVPYLQGVALAASLAVLVVVAASVTLLPALLALAGPRVNKLRIPGLGRALARAEEDSQKTLAGRWANVVTRRPWTAAIAGGLVCLALAAPVLGLRLGFPDESNNPDGTTTKAASELVEQGFGPGANGTVLLAADLPKRSDAAVASRLAERVRETPGVAFVSPPRVNPAGDAAIVAVTPSTSPQSGDTTDLVRRLRDDVVPAATKGTDVSVYAGGMAAALEDQSELVADRLPLFVAAVVGLSFLLLLLAFRAPVVAAKAALMNLLSIGAAYGVISLFAEGGFAGGLIGIDSEVPVAPFIPVMMFAILFGLSMDYEVFLLSRVREEFLRHGDTTRAVHDGLAKTARVITAAAAIMVAVFLAFVTSPESFLKLLGIGMATAIFVDATIVRMVLVPAVMQLLGRTNWWLPTWLGRLLPRLDVEPGRRSPAPSEA